MFCPNCGVETDGKFCPKCGKQILVDVKQTSEQPIAKQLQIPLTPEEQWLENEIKSQKRLTKTFLIVSIITLCSFFLIVTIPCGVCLILVYFSMKKKLAELEHRRQSHMYYTVRTEHVAGLPVGSYMACNLSLCGSGLCVSVGASQFNLDYSKMTAAEVCTRSQISYTTTSSASSGVLGAMFFGTVGAVIGSRPVSQKKIDYDHYLILNYQSNGEIQAIAFHFGEARKQALETCRLIYPHISFIPKQVSL